MNNTIDQIIEKKINSAKKDSSSHNKGLSLNIPYGLVFIILALLLAISYPKSTHYIKAENGGSIVISNQPDSIIRKK